MQPDARDAAHLWRMLKPAQYLTRVGKELSLERLRSDEEKQFAVAKALELIGEAARNLSTDFQTEHQAIPWSQVRGMRHFLAHEYHRADWALVWATITDDVPTLLAQIEPLLPEVPAGEEDDNPL